MSLINIINCFPHCVPLSSFSFFIYVLISLLSPDFAFNWSRWKGIRCRYLTVQALSCIYRVCYKCSWKIHLSFTIHPDKKRASLLNEIHYIINLILPTLQNIHQTPRKFQRKVSRVIMPVANKCKNFQQPKHTRLGSHELYPFYSFLDFVSMSVWE